MPSLEEEAEAVLFSLAQRAGGLDPLLKVFFGFLHRRTDLYSVIPPGVDNARMGFREGAAEQMVVRAFRSFPFKTIPATAAAATGSGGQAVAPKTASKATPEAASEAAPREASEAARKAAPEAAPKAAPKAAPSERAQLSQGVTVGDDGVQVPLDGNGGVTDRYYWQQSLQELTVFLEAPEGTSAKDVTCSIEARGLSVRVRGLDEPLLAGTYPEPERARVAESLWSFESATHTIILSLEKARETWWDAVLAGEPRIDTTKVDSTRKITEYDDATQAHIRKIMFDQRQKAQGLPTSADLERDEILAKARDLPGSPFAQDG